MTLLRLLHFGNLFLALWLYSLLVICSSTKGDPEAGRYVTITNIGIKMCQAKCVRQGGCFSFEYHFKTLICQIPTGNTNIKEVSGSRFLLKDQTQVFEDACGSLPCHLGLQCLKTRSGKAVCVEGGRQFSPKRCPERVKKSEDVNNQFHAACREGDICRVRNILAEGKVDINSRTGKYNRTPVMEAARKGHGLVFDFLVSKGCDLSQLDTMGNTILHMACHGGDIATVRYILSQGNVDVDSRGYEGTTPLMIAALTGRKQVFDLLVNRGGNITKVNARRNNMLHLACSGGHTGIVKYILSQNIININSRGYYRRTPLMMTVRLFRIKVFELLLDRGGDVFLTDVAGDNALHLACGGHVEMVKYILSHTKLDINSRGRQGRTPLMKAAKCGRKYLFELLLDRGGDVFLTDAVGDNALHLACDGGHVEMVKYILSHTKLDINSGGCQGRTPLMKAAKSGRKYLFDLLLDRGGDVSLRDASDDNTLHIACAAGQFEIVKDIISLKKVNINSKGHNERTPLMAAAYAGHKKVFKLLVAAKGDVSLVDANGDDILSIACSGGHSKMIKYLLSENMWNISRVKSNRCTMLEYGAPIKTG